MIKINQNRHKSQATADCVNLPVGIIGFEVRLRRVAHLLRLTKLKLQTLICEAVDGHVMGAIHLVSPSHLRTRVARSGTEALCQNRP